MLNAVFYPIADSWITIGLVLLLTQCSMSPIRGTFAINSSRVAEKLYRTENGRGLDRPGVETLTRKLKRGGVLGKIGELTFVE